MCLRIIPNAVISFNQEGYVDCWKIVEIVTTKRRFWQFWKPKTYTQLKSLYRSQPIQTHYVSDRRSAQLELNESKTVDLGIHVYLAKPCNIEVFCNSKPMHFTVLQCKAYQQHLVAVGVVNSQETIFDTVPTQAVFTEIIIPQEEIDKESL